MVKSKENILSQFGELELTEYGDFAIRKELVEDYSPIDIHAHCFVSISGMLPGIMRKQKYDYFNSPFYDLSCYPGKINNFDFDKAGYRTWPETVLSIYGLRTISELLGLEGVVPLIQNSSIERDMEN